MSDELRIANLERRLDEIIDRLKKLETPAPPPAPILGPPVPIDTDYAAIFRDAVKPSSKTPRPIVTPSTSSGPETSHIMAFIGSVCFVLASAFLIKLAIDSGWLTPMRQLAMAALIGFGLIGTGFLNFKRDNVYFSFLPATGIVILYMTVFASCLYYQVIKPEIGILWACGVSVLALTAQQFFRQNVYVFVATLGTYLSPCILNIPSGPGFDRAFYFLVWDVVFCWLAINQRNRSFLLLAAYLGLGVFAMMHPTASTSSDLANFPQAAGFTFLQMTIFVIGTSMFSIKNKLPLTESESWICFPLLIFFYGIEYSYLNRISAETAPWICLIIGALLLIVFEYTKKQANRLQFVSGPVIYGFLSIVLLHSLYLQILPDAMRPWFGLAVMIILGMLAQRKVRLSTEYKIAAGVAGLVVIVEYMVVLVGGHDFSNFETWLLNFLYAVLLGYAYFELRKQETKSEGSTTSKLLIGAANLQATAGLARLMPEIFPWFGNYAISASWTAFSLILLKYSMTRKDSTLAFSSLMVLAVAAAKVLLLDMSNVGAVARILSLLTIGAAMYWGGYLFKRVKSWDNLAQ